MREAASFIASQSSSARAGLLRDAYQVARALARYWKSRRDLARLSEFDDHQLSDIGVTREDVQWALGLPFARDPSVALQERALRRRARGWRS